MRVKITRDTVTGFFYLYLDGYFRSIHLFKFFAKMEARHMVKRNLPKHRIIVEEYEL